jgi:hypothetical protein
VAVAAVAALLLLCACKTSDAAHSIASAGESVASTASGAATSLVNVDLSNVLNDLAVKLNVDRANIPVNAQIPITIAANVCGVSINILSVSQGGTSKGCTAVSVSPELTQTVQQQLQAGSGTQSGTPTAPTTNATPTPTTTTPPPPTTLPQ